MSIERPAVRELLTLTCTSSATMLADGSFVSPLAGKDEREVTCEGSWSTSREGLPDEAPCSMTTVSLVVTPQRLV